MLVVGGGSVGARRARDLAAAGALVHVVAPRPGADVTELAAAGRLTVHRRRYRSADLAGAWLVVAATDEPGINGAVAADAEGARVWCVRADDAERTAAAIPAVTRSAGLTVAVGAGGDPRRAAAVRTAIRLALDTGGLPLRGHRPTAGNVALVGGGPGAPGLITVRGRALLAEADVVVADALAPRALLDTVDPDVEVVDAGKAPHRRNLTQEQVNALLVDRARRGLRVVRLKGGDPFVFGRGGEEALACAAAGVPFEVVPGVSSATAVPACAGIPVTHRGITQDFAVISGHVDPSHPGSTVDWEAAAVGPGTLVLLMAVGSLGLITSELVKRGRDPATPAAVISAGTTESEQVLTAELGTIAAAVAAAGIRPPAVVVVGEVVRLRDRIAAG